MYDVTPHTTEKDTACGPTCLQMLLEYYGIMVNLQTLIDECGVDTAGCSGATLLRVGRLHGLTDMMAFSMDAEELIRQDRPAIIWWTYNHWNVFAGRDDKGQVVICNPNMGRFSIDAGTFGALFTQVCLFNGNPGDLPEQPDMIATDNIAKGKHFIARDNVYKATAAILKGAAILPGVNCRRITLDEMIGG